jgi:flagellar biosynthesis/type III secretory pathway protein FliH
LLANSPKNEQSSSTETCALYYFPEIPNADNSDVKAVSSSRFTGGSFKNPADPTPQKNEQEDPAKIQALIEEAFNNGLVQGRAEIRAAQEEQINSAVAATQAVTKELQRIRRQDVECMESETVRLALAITKKIIGHETEHGEIVHYVVKQAMEKVNDTRQLVIKLNPNDLETVKSIQHELIPEDDLGTSFRIETDEGVKRGGCVIETKLGDIDARIDQQLKIIEELLVDQIPKSSIRE